MVSYDDSSSDDHDGHTATNNRSHQATAYDDVDESTVHNSSGDSNSPVPSFWHGTCVCGHRIGSWGSGCWCRCRCGCVWPVRFRTLHVRRLLLLQEASDSSMDCRRATVVPNRKAIPKTLERSECERRIRNASTTTCGRSRWPAMRED